MTYDVVGLGSCGIDLQIRVPTFPGPNSKVTGTELSVTGGGVTANNIVQTARLGLSTLWIGALGNDARSTYLLQEFEKNGIAAKPIVIENVPSQQYLIITDNKKRSGLLGLPGATAKLEANHIDAEWRELITSAKHLHIEIAVTPLSPTLEAARIAKAHGVTILVDIDNDPYYLTEQEGIGTSEEVFEILRLANVAKFSCSAACGFTKKKELSDVVLKEILGHGPRSVVVTDGKRGSHIGNESGYHFAPAYKIENVDDVGAGDAFMGGLSYALLQNWDLREAAKFANACGAYKCMHAGTRSSGTLKEIEDFMKKYD